MKTGLYVAAAAVSALAVCCLALLPTPAAVHGRGVSLRQRMPGPCHSPVALAADEAKGVVYVADATAMEIAFVDVQADRVVQSVPLPQAPSGVALSPEGDTLYVTAGGPDGIICALHTGSGRVTRRIEVGHTPMAPVAGPGGRTLYACNRFDNDVSVVDLRAGTEIRRIAVRREPVAAAITPDGQTLFVANHLPDGRADSGYTSAVVSVIDTTGAAEADCIKLPNGSSGLRGIAVSPDGRHVYLTHILARYQFPTTQLERGWMNTNALTVIDVARRKRINTVLLDEMDRGAANPWGVAVTSDGAHVCVAHAGTHEVSVIDRRLLHERLDRAEAGDRVTDVTSSAADVPHDLSFLAGPVRQRIKLNVSGPRGVATLGSKVCAGEYFAGSLAVAEADAEEGRSVRSIDLGPQPPMTDVRRGEELFNDAALGYQNWQSCASCHPDGRADGLNWDLLNDGIGNPKNAKSLLLAHRTPPAMISGIRSDAETAVRAGMLFTLFSVRPAGEANALDAYIKSLQPVPSPRLVRGRLSRSARRGRRVFREARCADCHPPDLFTDLAAYDVGTGVGRERGRAFDTPTLLEVWRTAPYLCIGQAPDMKSALTECNAADEHGRTSGLSDQQVEDLVEYVLSL